VYVCTAALSLTLLSSGCTYRVTHQPRSNKRWFSRACVRDTSATATISGQTANVWGYTSLWDPLHDHAIPQLLEFAVITREDAKAGDYYCPVPDDNSGICEGTTFCNKNFECDPAPTDPSHKECTMREWGSIIDDSPKSPYSRFLASPHAKSAKMYEPWRCTFMPASLAMQASCRALTGVCTQIHVAQTHNNGGCMLEALH